MQVVLGSRGDYAVRSVLYLARHPGRQRRRDISMAMEIPDTYVPQILSALVTAGIVRSTVGRVGGYELARPPDRISLREVVEVAEGPLQVDKCLLRGGPCYWVERCALHDAWTAAGDALSVSLASISFAELSRRDEEIEAHAAAAGLSRRGPHAPLVHTQPAKPDR
jgi:Rrf2 family protein